MSFGIKLASFSALCLIWSSTWIMIKVGLEGAPPVKAAGLRFIIASLLILAILVKRHIALPRTRHFLLLSLYLGIFQMAIPYALVYWAEQFITSGLTAILFSTMPLTVAVLARIILKDPLTLRKVSGIAIGIAGVYVIFSDSMSWAGREGILGMIAALTSAFFASLSSVMVKKFSHRYHPFASIFLPLTIGAVFLTASAAVIERNIPVEWSAITITSIIYLAVLGSVVAFALYFWLIKHMDVTALSYQTFIIPILASVIGWIFLRESITMDIAIGGGLIVAGIALAVMHKPQSKRLPNARP